MAQYTYDRKFIEYAASSSRYSAGRVVALLKGQLPIDSVLDVGCAAGTWLSVWRDAGVGEIRGVDGAYVDRSTLEIADGEFSARDLAEDFDLGTRFDLVQSLEVAEHIAAHRADAFVENLVRHSRGLVLFSAAPPGQGGEYHVNEQPCDYWRERFARHGYDAYDAVRPALADDRDVSFWYRYNTLLFVRRDRAPALPAAVAATRLADGEPVPDRSPLWFRLRKGVVRMLPDAVQQALARFKSNLLPSGRI